VTQLKFEQETSKIQLGRY